MKRYSLFFVEHLVRIPGHYLSTDIINFNSMENNPNNSVALSDEKQSERRYNLSRIIIWCSLSILTVLALFVLFKGVLDPSTVFTALVGLVGTWIGTVLAFYFSKDNFEAASKSTEQLIKQMTSSDKLKSTKSEEAMLRLDKVNYLKLEKDKKFTDYILKQLLADSFKNYNRLPVLNHEAKPIFIIHRSIIDKFVTESAFGGKDPATLTLDDLNVHSQYGPAISKSFACVRIGDDLLIAKTLMEKLSTGEFLCSDIFVTQDGTSKSEVIGWITNIDLLKYTQV